MSFSSYRKTFRFQRLSARVTAALVIGVALFLMAIAASVALIVLAFLGVTAIVALLLRKLGIWADRQADKVSENTVPEAEEMVPGVSRQITVIEADYEEIKRPRE